MAKPSKEHAIIAFRKPDSPSPVEKLDFILKYGDETTKEALIECVDFAYSVVCEESRAGYR